MNCNTTHYRANSSSVPGDPTDPIRLRDLALVRLRLLPVRYDAVTRTLTQYRRLRVRLTLSEPATLVDAAVDTGSTPYDRVLATVAKEQGLLVRWQGASETPAADPAPLPAGGLRLTVARAGVHRISAARLQAAGLDLSDPTRLALFQGGQPVPLHLKHVAGTLDSLTFVARTVGNRYTNLAYFDLALKPDGARMGTYAATSGTGAARIRRQAGQRRPTLYISNSPAHVETDHWFSDYLTAGHPTVTQTLSLTAPAASGDARLALSVASTGNATQRNRIVRVLVAVNGQATGEVLWQGPSYQSAVITVPADRLQDGANQVQLTYPADSTLPVYVDRLTLDYASTAPELPTAPAPVTSDSADWTLPVPAAAGTDVYRIDEAGVPTVAVLPLPVGAFGDPTWSAPIAYAAIASDDGAVTVTPRPAPTLNLKDPTLSAEHLIISPAALLPEAERLARHRRSQGLASLVVPVETIYETFGSGYAEPEAIQRFLRWTAAHWASPKPSYVVLFGGGHFDPTDRLGKHAPNQLVPMMTETTLVGEVPDDTGLASLDGTSSLPSFLVGRLPVKTLAEATAVVDKLIAYDGASGAWLSDAVGAYDNDDPRFAGMVTAAETALSDWHWQSFGIERALAMKTRMHEGAGLTLFVGHGSDWGWAQENIFDGDDLPLWPKSDHTGFVIAANCMNGYFANVWFAGLGESMVTLDHAGAVAFWGTSGFTLPGNQVRLLADVSLRLKQPGMDLGTATTLAKLTLFLSGAPLWQDEVSGWVLLGDPATRLHR